MDRILMQGMSFYGFTGVLPFEKQNGQTFLVDVEMELPPIHACETDELNDTVSYADAFEIVQSWKMNDSIWWNGCAVLFVSDSWPRSTGLKASRSRSASLRRRLMVCSRQWVSGSAGDVRP